MLQLVVTHNITHEELNKTVDLADEQVTRVVLLDQVKKWLWCISELATSKVVGGEEEQFMGQFEVAL